MVIKISTKINKQILFFLCFLTLCFVPCAFSEETKTGSIEGVVHSKKAKYRKYAVAYIENVPMSFEPPAKHAVMDQKNMTFIPHVLPIVKGTTVDFLNSDTVRHNIYSPDEVADNVNLGTWLQGEVRSFTFNKLGVATMLCNVHSDMSAYILVLQNPFYAKVKKDGTFVINDIPEGNYTLKLWHSHTKSSFWRKQLKADDVKVEVKSGKTAKVEVRLK